MIFGDRLPFELKFWMYNSITFRLFVLSIYLIIGTFQNIIKMFYLLLPLVLAKVELVDDKLLEAAKSFTDPKHAHLHPDLSLLIAMLLCVIAPICLALFETRVSGK